jgi:hypothetical protein
VNSPGYKFKASAAIEFPLNLDHQEFAARVPCGLPADPFRQVRYIAGHTSFAASVRTNDIYLAGILPGYMIKGNGWLNFEISGLF